MNPVNSTAAISRTPAAIPPDHVIFGRSSVMDRVQEVVDPIALVPIPVLIFGATGTGKEVMANYIHRRSPWKEGPFVKISCAAIPGALLEAELFGFEQSAFTGAIATKPGLVELAEGGTLMLDNVADLDLMLQPKLLHFLQTGTFNRIGGRQDLTVKTRVICTANRSLDAEIEQGTFREDLYHRISGASVPMPRLREREDDLLIIAEYLLVQFAAQFQLRVRSLSTALARRLRHHSWPGNIWELENVLRRYSILGTSNAIGDVLVRRPYSHSVADLPLSFNAPLKVRAQRMVQEAETQVILQVLQQHDWNRTKSAQTLNISLRALLYKMRIAGISGHRIYKEQN
jgi:two-component system, NtrC family, response regulator AtoC